MKRKEHILIVEDNKFDLEHFAILANKAGFECYCVPNLESARNFIQTNRIDILITDIFLSFPSNRTDGIDLIRETLELQPHILPLVISGTPDQQIYLEAIKNGALFYLKKPVVNEDEILIAIETAQERRLLKSEQTQNRPSSTNLIESLCKDGLCLEKEIRSWIEVAAVSPELPVTIEGETGTGKEEIAKLIHKYRKKREGNVPFVSVNCALLDGDLVQSILFGHKKGAFSGACSSTLGFIAEANNGILFLDEIHSLPLHCQQKILRVLNDGSFNRVGETKEYTSKFQLIAASTQDLDDAVLAGRFLMDLKSRLTGCNIKVKPLRERINDLPIIVELFFVKKGIEMSSFELSKIIDACKDFYWQGNIRQMYQCLKAMLAVCSAKNLRPDPAHIPLSKTMYAPPNVKSSQ